MNRQEPHRPSGFTKAAGALSFVTGVIAAYLATPVSYSSSVHWVMHFTQAYYGADMLEVVRLAGLIVLALLIFNITRLLVNVVLSAGGLFLALRFIPSNRKD